MFSSRIWVFNIFKSIFKDSGNRRSPFKGQGLIFLWFQCWCHPDGLALIKLCNCHGRLSKQSGSQRGLRGLKGDTGNQGRIQKSNFGVRPNDNCCTLHFRNYFFFLGWGGFELLFCRKKKIYIFVKIEMIFKEIGLSEKMVRKIQNLRAWFHICIFNPSWICLSKYNIQNVMKLTLCLESLKSLCVKRTEMIIKACYTNDI